ncbi:ras guanine nucleotide exchange factor domain-containing protein [Entophlyctis helioformis]|nr:ras guanine nucleotide exchange factor domain-containing protein [Entophlyctis helioformis]
MEEIQSFELLKDIPDDVVLDQEDVTRLEASGVKLPMVEYPYPLKPILRTAFEDVKTAARQVMAKGKIASASWPPPNSASEMLQATIPCVLSVKKVVILAKETATKVRHTFLEERRKQDNWRKECLQNERVKQLFQMWEGQLLGDQNPIGKKPATQLTKEELSFLEDSPEGLVAEEINGKRVIKGGRLNKLLEASTHHMVNDEDFMAAMIMTHHSFTTTTELMDQLFKRYDIAPPYGLNQRMFDVYLDKKVVQVRLRVCHVLLHWIQNHFEEDFVDYEQYILRYRDFVEKKVAFDFEQLSVTMLQALDAKLLEEPRARMIPQLGAEREKQCPKPILPTRAFAGVDLLVALTTDLKAFMDIDPQEMARQLTLVEFELFARVKPYECLDQIWDGHRRKEAQAIKGANPKRHDPNSGNTDISKLIQHTNQLSFWIATNIASQDNLKMRMNIVKYFVQVAMHCRELNNLTGVTTIIGAFTMSPISRLHKTWKILEDKHPKISDAYKELADIVSPRFQYANYRKVLKEMAPPAIPFLGVYLTDLTFIELGNPDFLPDSHFINFEKRRKVYNLIREIQRFEQVPFALTPVPAIQEFVRRLGDKRGAPTGWEEMPLMTEDELYDRSLIIEPREEETDSDDN